MQRKQSKDSNIFDLDIKISLFKEKIKFKIKEIQDNLKNNPILYETDFEMNNFGKLSDYYKNQGGIKELFEFLISIFNDNKDVINRETNKIIIKVKYVIFVNKEDEIIFEINKKEVGLKNILTNVDETLRVLNKDIIETKEEFKKDLLEKVYPIGSYYWTEEDISPEKIFGGKWEKIEGRFLFASSSFHWVGETGGEERHQLTIDEIPQHNHYYNCCELVVKEKSSTEKTKKEENKKDFNSFDEDYDYDSDDEEIIIKGCHSEETEDEKNFFYTNPTKPINLMPPYLVANCWKRIS